MTFIFWGAVRRMYVRTRTHRTVANIALEHTYWERKRISQWV